MSPRLSSPSPAGATLNAKSMPESLPYTPPRPRPSDADAASVARHDLPRAAGVRPDHAGGDAVGAADRTLADDGGRHERDAGAADPPLGGGRGAAPARPDLRAVRGARAAHVRPQRQAADAHDG